MYGLLFGIGRHERIGESHEAVIDLLPMTAACPFAAGLRLWVPSNVKSKINTEKQ